MFGRYYIYTYYLELPQYIVSKGLYFCGKLKLVGENIYKIWWRILLTEKPLVVGLKKQAKGILIGLATGSIVSNRETEEMSL